MESKLFVGNLPYSCDDSTLESMFSPLGSVRSVKVIIDRETGRSKGFGFVEMASGQEAQQAMQSMNGKEIDGRAITVNEARPQAARSRYSRSY